MSKLQQIIENNPESEFLIADGYDDAVIGYCYISDRLIYSYSKCIEIDLTSFNYLGEPACYFDVIENLEFNTLNAYVGNKTPIFCMDNNM
tara:strand:+ start:364 stop:633 length:270 start_codon:yes stop_codon:yes gene_type:complete